MRRRGLRELVVLALLLASGVLATACAGAKPKEPPTPATQARARRGLEQAIADAPTPAQRRALEQFRARHGPRDRFTVTEHPDRYEIVVSHPSSDNLTGGAEQYFVDKETGEARMGWHEHPMEMPEVRPARVTE